MERQKYQKSNGQVGALDGYIGIDMLGLWKLRCYI